MKSWKKVLPMTAALAISGFMSFAYQNCARTKFSIDPAAKSEALAKEGVFGHQQGDDGNLSGSVPGDDSNTPGGSNPRGNDTGIPGTALIPRGNDPSVPSTSPTPRGNDTQYTNIPVNFSFLCSNSHSETAGGNLLTAQALKVVIVNNFNSVVCELTGDFKSQILNTKKVTFTPCAGLTPGKYEAHVIDAKNAASSFLSKELTQDDIKFTLNANGTYNLSTPKVEIVYDFNKDNSRYASDNASAGGTSTADTQKNCDNRVSPLIISMSSKAKGIKLSAPLDGIQFDILGENSFPMAHDKKQISWLTTEDQEYYFIVLPNKDGKVLGINEMFGDNTRGPDGKFAANGYAALAKYDTDKDALITDQDAIYSDLRLWIDRNRDGIADPNELYTLKEKGLTVIDLHYDKRYKETDQYGNQTLMKSVVKTEDGKLHLLFDLWFRYINITK